MDWSLVLVSQGIESVIDSDPDAGWGLIVSADEHIRALEILEQYRKENRRWPWRRNISGQGLLFDWGSAAWVLLIAFFFWLDGHRPGLHEAALMDAEAVSHGEWWRLFTAILLHADVGHLAQNAAIGFVLLGLTMGRYGTGVGLLAAYLAGAGGYVGTWLVFVQHASRGASGMVMGCVGLLAAQSIPIPRRNPQALKYATAGLIGGVLLFVLMGLGTEPRTDFVAHFGGFLTGLALGTMLTFVSGLAQSKAANLIAGAVFATLVVLTWWLALRA
jgi:membrane associated rhomboid family serine protease